MTEQTGSITDVPGIKVGQVHRTDAGWLSGVTVVLPPQGSIGAVDVRGGGPGTHETDALDPTTLVPTVDAVVLTGGSAYGLAAATGVQQWCEEEGRGFPVSGGVVPIVPAAAIFDLGRGGDFRARPGAEMGYLAAQAAGASVEYDDVARGNAGAGTGAALGRGTFKGGTGTASRTLRGANASVVVGALAVVNAAGLPWDPHHQAWETGPRSGAAGPGSAETRPAGTGTTLTRPAETGTTLTGPAGTGSSGMEPPGLNTTLVVVATNAVLAVAQAKRTATAAHAGMARALNPVHTLADGDTVFVLATGERALDPGDGPAVVPLMELQAAAAEAVTDAILDGIRCAATVRTPQGPLPAWPGEADG